MRYRTLKVGDVRQEGDVHRRRNRPKGAWVPVDIKMGVLDELDMVIAEYRRPLPEKEIKAIRTGPASKTTIWGDEIVTENRLARLERVYALAREFISERNQGNDIFSSYWFGREWNDLAPFLGEYGRCVKLGNKAFDALNAEFLKEGERE